MRPLQNCYIQINSLSHQQGPIASADDVRNTCTHRVFYDADKINSKIKAVCCKDILKTNLEQTSLNKSFFLFSQASMDATRHCQDI